jgi:hypothetical protein
MSVWEWITVVLIILLLLGISGAVWLVVAHLERLHTTLVSVGVDLHWTRKSIEELSGEAFVIRREIEELRHHFVPPDPAEAAADWDAEHSTDAPPAEGPGQVGPDSSKE